MDFLSVRHSISRKVLLAVLATTLIALLIASACLLILDIRNYEAATANDLRSQADIMAQVTLPALEFDDAASAQQNLSHLSIRPRIYAAALYRADGSVLASYGRKGEARALPAMPAHAREEIANAAIQVFVPIARGSERLGMMYIGAEYPLAAQVRYHGGVLAIVTLASLGVAWFMSRWLQAAITKPILVMTAAVNEVIRRRDFSTRVAKSTEDEVGTLVDAFNSMLGEVGDRASALEQSNQRLQHEVAERESAEQAVRQLNSTLEERIAERSAELERAHAQLRQSQKLEAIGQLTGGVAHDFNNVLQVISGNLQMLQMTSGQDPAVRKRVETAIFAADRGAKLSSQLLAFARRQPLQPLPTNVGRVLRGMDDLLRRALGESIDIETVVAGGLWTTLVDPHQLENVILNLAINARDAMKGNGRLTLELGNAMLNDDYVANVPELHPGHYVVLAISDTGCGMPPEVIARAFEPFYTTKPEGQGTGLGLSMAYGFVKQSEGHIQIYSEPGNGTTIKVYLPRSTQPEVETGDRRSTAMVGGSETILVVEDDLAVQTTVVDILSGLGYRVLRANDGQSALTIIQSGVPVDLIFTDVVMPGPVRSIEMTRQAKQLCPDIQVLYTSGYTQNAIVHGGRLDPGVELISKPYRREELARKLRTMLSGAAKPASAPPLAPAPAPAPVSTAGAPAALAPAAVPLAILVVEDNGDARSILLELLNMLGHKTDEAATAEEALRICAERSFDVLLTDYKLPGMTGLELARQVHQASKATRIVFSSGHGPELVKNAGIPCKALIKPFSVEALQDVLA
jgi:signal transduction histidine kinase/DNA-binding response OmpR family regulator